MGCSPSSSDMTINESVNVRDSGSDFGTGLITCNIMYVRIRCLKRTSLKPNERMYLLVVLHITYGYFSP